MEMREAIWYWPPAVPSMPYLMGSIDSPRLRHVLAALKAATSLRRCAICHS